jgi:hypothetical protein
MSTAADVFSPSQEVTLQEFRDAYVKAERAKAIVAGDITPGSPTLQPAVQALFDRLVSFLLVRFADLLNPDHRTSSRKSPRN